MKTQEMIRAVIVLLILGLSTTSALASGQIHKEDFEVSPDYSQMDPETAITTMKWACYREQEKAEAFVAQKKDLKVVTTYSDIRPGT